MSSQIAWDLANKLVTFVTLLGFIAAVIRWILRRTRIRPPVRLLAWALTGQADEKLMVSILAVILRYFFAIAVWAVLGAIVGVLTIVAWALLSLGLGAQLHGTLSGMLQNATLGAFAGALFRGLIWPILSAIAAAIRKARNKADEMRKRFTEQTDRVERQLNRSRKR